MIEKINKLFFKNIYLIKLFIFLFLVFVFVNFTHNNFDGTNDIKIETSSNLSSNETYSFFFDRSCEVTGGMHDRHKVRWIKAFTLKNIFQKSSYVSNIFPYYLNIILHSLLLFSSLILLNKSLSLDRKYIVLFLLYVTFVFQQHLSEYSYSIFEMFFLSLAIFSSKNKKNLLFLVSCILASLNRESGFIILLTWLIFNNDYKRFFIFSLITLIIFIAVNYDIFDCLINPNFFLPLERQYGQTNISDLSNINLFSLIKVITINFLFPFGLGFYFYLNSINKNKILLSLYFIYFLIFLIATPVHHMAVKLILLPIIFTTIYYKNYQKSR